MKKSGSERCLILLEVVSFPRFSPRHREKISRTIFLIKSTAPSGHFELLRSKIGPVVTNLCRVEGKMDPLPPPEPIFSITGFIFTHICFILGGTLNVVIRYVSQDSKFETRLYQIPNDLVFGLLNFQMAISSSLFKVVNSRSNPNSPEASTVHFRACSLLRGNLLSHHYPPHSQMKRRILQIPVTSKTRDIYEILVWH